MHFERHAGSPLQAPRQLSYVEHVASAAHADDSAQQFALAQAAQVVVPYGIPQAVAVSFSGALSVIPTTWRQRA